MSDFTTPLHERGYDEENFHARILRDPAKPERKFSKTDWKWLFVAFVLLVLFLTGLYWWKQDVAEPVVVAQPSTFVANAGDSLVKEYGYDDSISVAEFVGLPLSKRELGGKLVPISYTEARNLRSQTDRNLVRAPVYPGDRINSMRYPSGQVDLINGFVLFSPAPGSPELAKR